MQLTSQHASETRHRVATLVEGRQALSSSRQEGPAGLGQRNAAVVSHKEGLSELPLESLDRGAQAGLHDVDPRLRRG